MNSISKVCKFLEGVDKYKIPPSKSPKNLEINIPGRTSNASFLTSSETQELRFLNNDNLDEISPIVKRTSTPRSITRQSPLYSTQKIEVQAAHAKKPSDNPSPLRELFFKTLSPKNSSLSMKRYLTVNASLATSDSTSFSELSKAESLTTNIADLEVGQVKNDKKKRYQKKIDHLRSIQQMAHNDVARLREKLNKISSESNFKRPKELKLVESKEKPIEPVKSVKISQDSPKASKMVMVN